MCCPTEATENFVWPHFGRFAPTVRVLVRIPIVQRAMKGINNLICRFKPTTFEGQSLELLPPGFDQIEPASILGNELKAYLGPSQQGSLDIAAFMNDEVVFDDQPTVTRKDSNHLLQQLNMRGTIARRATKNCGQASSWFEGAVNPDGAATTVVRFEGGPVRSDLPLLTRVGFSSNRSQFVKADNSSARWRPQVCPDDAPLFSTNSGSCLSASWNQLCCRFQTNPSAFNHFQMVEVPRSRPYRSSYSFCRRGKVHNSYGKPSERGFCSARSITRERTFSVWVTGRPARGLSCRPVIPSALNRFTHCGPVALLVYPTISPASVAYRSGSSSMALISRARWTIRADSVRDLARRVISSISSVVKVLKTIRFLDIIPSQ